MWSFVFLNVRFARVNFLQHPNDETQTCVTTTLTFFSAQIPLLFFLSFFFLSFFFLSFIPFFFSLTIHHHTHTDAPGLQRGPHAGHGLVRPCAAGAAKGVIRLSCMQNHLQGARHQDPPGGAHDKWEEHPVLPRLQVCRASVRLLCRPAQSVFHSGVC